MKALRSMLKALSGCILILLGTQISLKQIFGISVPFLSGIGELLGGFILIFVGILLLKGLLDKQGN